MTSRSVSARSWTPPPGAGTRVEVLCLTQGEAPTLHEVPGELTLVRGAELAAAGDALGVTHTTLHHHRDCCTSWSGWLSTDSDFRVIHAAIE